MIFTSGVVVLLISCAHIIRAQENEVQRPSLCPTYFGIYRGHYRHCVFTAGYDRDSFMTRQTYTGEDLVQDLETFCSRADRVKRCFRETYQSCQDDLRDILEESLAKSLWLCNGNDVRESVVTALMANNDSIPESETRLSTCVIDSRSSCASDTSAAFPHLSRPTFRVPIADLLGNPRSTEYFYALMDCAHEKTREACPHNALAMALMSQDHMIFPPKFAINVSDIILHMR